LLASRFLQWQNVHMANSNRSKAVKPKLSFHPLTAERWPDLEKLFGERGACGGCWCMAWRLPRAEWEAGRGEPHKRALAGGRRRLARRAGLLG
jgi:hypothetical protein